MGHFQGLLHRNTIKADADADADADVQKSVDANLEFLVTVFKGNFHACACKILEISKLDDPVHLPPSLTHKSTPTQLQFQFIQQIASQIEECTLTDTRKEVQETDNKLYNYTQVLCTCSRIQRWLGRR